jgi:tellurite methyltransferase
LDPKEKWNLKYRDRLMNEISPEPNKRLLDMSAYLKGGTAIDIASGLGGNSIFLAEIGFEVTAVDISEVAINYVKGQAAGRKLDITARIADLSRKTADFSSQKYDLSIMTYYLDRSLFPLIKEVVKEDGYLFFETYYQNGTEENQHVSNRYKLVSNELLKEFIEWRVLYFEENEQEGRQTIFCQKRSLISP